MSIAHKIVDLIRMDSRLDAKDNLVLFQQQRLAILLDDTASGQHAVIVAPAAGIEENLINRMLHLSGGNMCVALSRERAAAFLLSPMSRPRTAVGESISFNDLNMCVSVEAREGVTTGISAADRAATVRVLGEAQPNARKLVKPGHIFPVETREGGVLVKYSLPEGALDIVKLAGFTDAALFMDLLDESGAYADLQNVTQIAAREDLPLFTLAQITLHRLENEKLVERVAEARLPTKNAGEVRSIVYKSSVHEGEHLALVKGEINPDIPTLTRVQAEYTFSDVFGGSHPDSRKQLQQSLQAIGERGSGVLLYLRRPLRGQVGEQVSSSATTPHESSTMREYGLGSQILRDLGVRKIELLTNSPRDYSGVKSFGIDIVSQRPLS